MENKNINKKLLAFQSEIQAIKKDGKNPHFKSNYATLPQILSEVKPLLTKHNLIVLQPICDNKVITHIADAESGEFIEGKIDLPINLTPQQIGSAITYYRRYLLAGMLSLEIEDDDGSEASINTTDTRTWLNEGTSVFTQAVKFLKDGGLIGDIEKKYKMQPKTKEALIAAAA